MNSILLALARGVAKRVVISGLVLSFLSGMTAQASGLVISSIANAGSNLIVTGSGGLPGVTYYVMVSTNLGQAPLALGQRVATNIFSGDSQFTNTIPINPSVPEAFMIVATTLPAKVPGLVAAYSFDEGAGTNVMDSSGNTNNGTIGTATWTPYGKYGGALAFNGSSSFVSVTDSASLHLTTGMTLEAWVNPVNNGNSAGGNYADVIYKGGDNYYLEGSSPDNYAPAGGGTFGGTDIANYGPSGLPDNQWSHVAMTYNGSVVLLYVNGVQVSSLAQTGNILTSTGALQIGGDSTYGQYFRGIIDDVRVYNLALTAAQIQADMNLPVGNTPTAPANLAATTVSSSQINLSWTPSTAVLGIGAYLVERQGVSDTNFVQVGWSRGTNYVDTSLPIGTNFSYRVRAVDAAGDDGPYSGVAQAYTSFAVKPRAVALTPTEPQQFVVNLTNLAVTWSVDGLAGGSIASGTISATGLYSPPNNIGAHTVTATTSDLSQTASATVYITANPGAFTHHNDNLRTGQNLNETVLNPTNVNQATFGELFSYPIDGISFASPLYVAGVNVPGSGYHNLVFVVTEHDSVYAFDADGLTNNPIWHDSFINPGAGVTTIPSPETTEPLDIPGEVGITGTPVIDPTNGTLYVVAATKEVSGGTPSYVNRLHALDIATGAEKFGGPVMIQASVSGTGLGAKGGMVSLSTLTNNQRPGLLLLSNVVYIGFADHGDSPIYHGWVLGYNSTNLQQVMTFCTTPNEGKGGVWHGGGGIAADASGNLFFSTGNGDFNANTTDYGDSVLKLSPGGAVLDYFTPFNQATLNSQDLDLSPGGVLLLPDQTGPYPHLMIAAGKFGSIHLINRDHMGGYSASGDTNIVQELPSVLGTPPNTYATGDRIPPVYFNETVYFSADADYIKAYHLTNGVLTTTPTSQSAEVYQYPGAPMAISANGSTNGILWVVERFGNLSTVTAPGILRAYDPANLTNIFYDSSQAGTRDTLDFAAKFSAPLVVNGKVFVASMSQLTVYGLLP
ncbi:MAG TPA: LamG-like jellyroll fold domain-containing protein [Candidatus Sulfopaludibacter sp.]|nr:LamG-like jellyroll fold domain-containing protein [Candidatus Sulfopaludibacter sp.]